MVAPLRGVTPLGTLLSLYFRPIDVYDCGRYSRGMLVFRVEHAEYGHGPFSFDLCEWETDPRYDDCIMARELMWWDGPNINYEIEDFFPGTDQTVLTDYEQLDQWFNDAWAELMMVGFAVAVYDIPDHLIRHSRWQSAAPLVSDPIYVPMEDFFI